MTNRMAIVPRTELTDDMLISGVAANQERMVADVYAAMLSASPHAGKVSREQFHNVCKAIVGNVDHMKYANREQVAQVVEVALTALGLEIE